MSGDVVTGEVRRPRNLSAEAVGSIHDDATAASLGFRGGTVAGNIHMDVFPRLLVDAFGARWFTDGSLDLTFLQPTVDGEPVRPVLRAPAPAPVLPDARLVEAWLETAPQDGSAPVPVARGDAGVGGAGPTALQRTDLRATNPSALRMLAAVHPGLAVPPATVHVDPHEQLRRVARGGCADPLPWYTEPSPWGAPVASPLTVVDLLYRHPSDTITTLIDGPFVGMFGAIGIRFVHGPVLLGATYEVSAHVVSVGESPKTETVWFDSEARDDRGRVVAAMRMQSRLLKASSPHYASA